MSFVADLPVRVVVFASEQLFPALQFLLHAADRFGASLHSIHIYCTRDERRSGEPAARLQNVMRRWGEQRGMGFSIEITTGDIWPAEVRAGLTDWFSAAPDSHWLVNVTGGTKPMSATAIELTLATDLPSRRVIYQEIDGLWVELVSGEDGLLEAQPLKVGTDPAVPLPDTLDRLVTVNDLVATQFSADHRITTQTLHALPVDEAVQQLLVKDWRWQASLAALAVPVLASGNGDAFERFVGAGLRDCGVRIMHSLKVTDNGPAAKVVREVDLVGCARGRLVCIDIKLPGAQEHLKGTQLADVAELAHSLGGRGALAIALRPGWPDDPETQRLAKALGVRLLTQGQAGRLFSCLLGWIDPSLVPSSAVLQAEQQLQAHQVKGNDVLSNGRSIDTAVSENGIVHLSSVMERISERRGEPWALVVLPSSQYFLGIPKKSRYAPPAAAWLTLEPKLESALMQVVDRRRHFSFKPTKAWVLAYFFVMPGVQSQDVLALIRAVLGSQAPA